MINLNIKEKTPPLENFPNDDIYRVVWAYGSVQKGSTVTGVPEIHILLVDLFFNEFTNKFELSNQTRVIKISIAQLDIVRYMTIWKGKKRLNGFWEDSLEYESNTRFDLDTTDSMSVKYSSLNQNGTYRYLFPYNKYKIANINKQNFGKFTNSTFTKISNDNYDVIVPSMELYTSTYTPHEQQIRNKLVQYSLDDTLSDYVKSSEEESGKYIIEMYHSKTTTNISFLAYASLNNITRQRLSKLRSSLENGILDKYPVILPYHPSNISLQGDGFWIDNKTFFMLRINNYSLPADFEIDNLADEIEVEENNKSNSQNKTVSSIKKDLDDYELPATNNHNPHIRNASLPIISEVGLLGDSKHKIQNKKKIIKIEKTENTPLVQNTENITNISSSEADSTNNSENTGKLYNKPENALQQSKALDLFLNDILQMRDEKVDISEGNNIYASDIWFMDENANIGIDKYFIQFNDILKAKNETNSFAEMRNRIEEINKLGEIKKKDNFLGYRRCFLLKICLSNGKWFYILEIERKEKKDNPEGFSGLLLKPENEFNQITFEDEILKIIRAKGIFKNVIFKDKNIIFKHTLNKSSGSLIDCFLKNFKKIIVI